MGSKLRGRALEEKAIEQIGSSEEWLNGARLTWNALAEQLGVTREAICKKEPVREAYKAAKNAKRSSPQALEKRTLRARITELEAQLLERDKQLDAWVQKWVAVEYNCRLHGYDADKVLALIRNRDV